MNRTYFAIRNPQGQWLCIQTRDFFYMASRVQGQAPGIVYTCPTPAELKGLAAIHKGEVIELAYRDGFLWVKEPAR